MTDDVSQSITVNSSPLPGNLASAFRSVIMAIGAWAIGKGYLTGDTLNAILTIGAVLLPFAYGQWKKYQDHKDAKALAISAPIGMLK